jgi:hypothetical protein
MGSTIDGIFIFKLLFIFFLLFTFYFFLFSFFLAVNVRVNGFIDSIIDPITNLNYEFGDVVYTVEKNLGSTQSITDAMNLLEEKFTQLGETADNNKGSSDCDSLGVIAKAANEASEATRASTQVFTDDLGAVTDSITENLIAAKGSISAATQSSQDSADDMKKVVADALTETSKQALSAANQISDHQGKISGGPFAWVRVCLFLFVDCIVFGS